eukprot:CAMPEP_0203762232 /NCGR_PEP_ID=MMETSP0098-20131031/15166_1 /ASSEMBLY_ACC=CAM_ASM_000208 /TAXON_ID=96639 /ORGANISM=" , Strain NY0313808BC1" /LENGTH=1044 /DNA_ID=CAMNT_0050656565 /DNA_START=478 /DNA_END=3612 /DNA_ORIENTATION=+
MREVLLGASEDRKILMKVRYQQQKRMRKLVEQDPERFEVEGVKDDSLEPVTEEGMIHLEDIVENIEEEQFSLDLKENDVEGGLTSNNHDDGDDDGSLALDKESFQEETMVSPGEEKPDVNEADMASTNEENGPVISNEQSMVLPNEENRSVESREKTMVENEESQNMDVAELEQVEALVMADSETEGNVTTEQNESKEADQAVINNEIDETSPGVLLGLAPPDLGDVLENGLESDTESTSESAISQEEVSPVLCKDIYTQGACERNGRCFWAGKTCRTQTWAMSCSMTQVKATCAKLPLCSWSSVSKTRGRYCTDHPCKSKKNEEECVISDECVWTSASKCDSRCGSAQFRSKCKEFPHCSWVSQTKFRGDYCKNQDTETAVENQSSGTVNSTEFVEVRIGNEVKRLERCVSINYETHCGDIYHCFWDKAKRRCRTELAFLACSSTRVRAKCEQMYHCTWRQRYKRLGRYCADTEVEDDNAPSDPSSQEQDDEDIEKLEVRIGDSVKLLERCKQFSKEKHCKNYEHCYWQSTSRSCRTKMAFLACSGTQLASKCKEMKHCNWSAKNRYRGNFCEDNVPEGVSENEILELESNEEEEQLATGERGESEDNPMVVEEEVSEGNSVTEEDVEYTEVRIGNETKTLAVCKLLQGELNCGRFSHCFWSKNGCRTLSEFLACSATRLKSKCSEMNHCKWRYSGKVKGQYCVDAEQSTSVLSSDDQVRCTTYKSKRKCLTKESCEWSSSLKSTGKFCERVVNSEAIEAELVPLFSSAPFNSELEIKENESARCPEFPECATPVELATLFQLDKDVMQKKTQYDQRHCCDYHKMSRKMFAAVEKHFRDVGFNNWYLDESSALGVTRLAGVLLPWKKDTMLSMVDSSWKRMHTIMSKFNDDFKYRPFSVRGCVKTSKKVECKTMDRVVKSASTLDFFLISHMDMEESPEMRIYPNIVNTHTKTCIFKNGIPIPLHFVLPTSTCYGGNFQCPKSIHNYLDLVYDSTWRSDILVKEKHYDSTKSTGSAYDIPNPSANSSRVEKLYWLIHKHCVTN